ncbi:acyltransferase family protein [Novosphingobium taihuense]|uniref:Glucan biosynthesis protein C n=1 Tax=Novosphingobium taihuense TaxID=260085 RepID=A0A7W7ADL7_9SPHN|nr:acyltransferase family protein [Novosphingobium taihuense]MBB4615099.1 glucan biosynthesis protein C [Novosphingobium taihuense]TWH84135.1 acyltransferase-like protein [Novosphingobium taihuense]
MTPSAKRLHHLDAARALLLLLGLPFHVATKAIFESDPAATEFQQSLLIGGWASITHVFRMFAFFMLAGYFAGMIRQRKGTGAWIAERTRRLGLPFLASLLTLGALQYQLQDSLLGKPSPTFLGLPLALDHLWFLVVLLGFCLTYAAVPVRWLQPGERMQRAMLLSGPGGLIVLGLLGLWGLVRYATEQVPPIPNAPSETLLWQQFVFHAASFALGIMAWHGHIGERLFALQSRWIGVGIVLLLVPYIPLDPLIRPALGREIYPDLAGTLTLRALELPLAYLMSLALFRVLAWSIRGPNRVVTFFVDGALAIYLFHLVWAMVLLPHVRSLPLPAEAQWLLGASTVLLLAVASYLAVRSTNLTSTLFCGTPGRNAKAPGKSAVMTA